jgi:hypothetical protein
MRDPDEKARFRGDDKAYSEGWDRIWGKKEPPACEHFETHTVKTNEYPFFLTRCIKCGENMDKEQK